jgi:hypothetical protein
MTDNLDIVTRDLSGMAKAQEVAFVCAHSLFGKHYIAPVAYQGITYPEGEMDLVLIPGWDLNGDETLLVAWWHGYDLGWSFGTLAMEMSAAKEITNPETLMEVFGLCR